MDDASLLEQAPLEPAAAAAASRVIAVVQSQGQRIGIDGAQVVQAVVVPPDLVAVPRRAGGIAGVMRRGEQLIPVVRLDRWLQADDAAEASDAPRSADARVVILRAGVQVVGLWVDAVIGMQRCPAPAVGRLFHDDRPDELFAHAVLLDPTAQPLMLLETCRLAALAGVWAEAAGLDTSTAASQATTGQAAAAHHHAVALQDSLGVFRVGDRLVGVASADIGELLRLPALSPPPYRHAGARGLSEWRGRLLPVVDVSDAIGAMPQAQATGEAWLCVLRQGERLLGLVVHELVELRAADGGLPAAPPGGDALVRCEWPIELGLLQVLDTAALMARYPESAISAQRGLATLQAAAAAASPHTYAVFEAAGGYAARIEGVQEIVPIPDNLRPRLEAGLAVSLQWRGHAVPVRGLFAEAAKCVAPAEARQLIVVEAGDCRVALPIVAMKAMIAPRSGTLARMRVGHEMVTIVSTSRHSEAPASYQVVDLAQRASAA